MMTECYPLQSAFCLQSTYQTEERMILMILMRKNLAAAAMTDSAPELPQDLINQVLIRLPAKSVGRFRCVSKPWRSHLSTPKFTKAHRNFHIHDTPRSIILPIRPKDCFFYDLLLLPSAADGSSDITIPRAPPEDSSDQFPSLLTFPVNGGDGSSRKVTSPLFSRQKGWIRVEAGCHGFVLVLLKGTVAVFNPLTLEALEVPRFPLPRNFGTRECQLGMGYDSVSDDYKIVMLSYNYGSRDWECPGAYVDVYSLKMNSWRSIANSPFEHDVAYPQPVAFTNGRLHWLAEDRNGYVLAAFNLDSEEFERVPSPSKLFDMGGGKLRVLGGCLAVECVMVNEYLWGEGCFWVMKEYGIQESWTKLEICPGFVCSSGEDEYICRSADDTFFGSSLSTGRGRVISVDGIPEDIAAVKSVITFTEFLLSPNHIA